VKERHVPITARWSLYFELCMYVLLLSVLLIYFKPSLIFSTTMATGGDTGAHIYAPWFLRESLIPKGQLSGWSPGWFAGFPMLHFYFPLVATFQAVLSYVIPYEVSFKLGTIIGTFFLPVSFYMFFRLLRFRFPTPILGAALALSFLFMDSFTIYGANIASSLAGEYSFAFSVGLCFVFYGLAYRVATEKQAKPLLAAGVLAMAVLSHVVPVIMVVLFSPVLIYWAIKTHGAKDGLRRFATVFSLAFALTAFWSIPFLARLGYTANMRWQPIEGAASLFPTELYLFVGGAAIGLLLGVLRRDRRVVVMAAPTIVAALFYLFLPQGHVWNGRFLPFWYLGVYLMCAYAVGTVIGAISTSTYRQGAAAVAMTLTAALVLGCTGYIIWNRNTTFVDFWIEYNYEGYEKKESFPVFEQLNEKIAQLPPGRVMWEPNASLGRFGTPVALMSLPYWADHPSMEGMYFESSFTTPFHFLMASEVAEQPSNPIADLPYSSLDLEKGVEHMRMLDVSYYMTVTEAAKKLADKQDGLTHLFDLDTYSMYEVDSPGQVVVPRFEPVRYEGPGWVDTNIEWFTNPNDQEVPLTRGGPETWAEATGTGEPLPRKPLDHGGESFEANIDDDSISFTTDAIGEPHWIKTSYFPNWKVEGAEGPYVASPTMMMVIPTQAEVKLYYARTWAEWLGLALTLSGMALLAIPAGRRQMRRLAGGTDGVRA
jgi:hypothetical protein